MEYRPKSNRVGSSTASTNSDKNLITHNTCSYTTTGTAIRGIWLQANASGVMVDNNMFVGNYLFGNSVSSSKVFRIELNTGTVDENVFSNNYMFNWQDGFNRVSPTNGVYQMNFHTGVTSPFNGAELTARSIDFQVASVGGELKLIGEALELRSSGIWIDSGAGAPIAGDCNSTSEIGREWHRTDGSAGGDAIYSCESNGLGGATWVERYLIASDAAVNLASVADGDCSSERTVAVSGAAFGDVVKVMAGTGLEAGTFLVGHVASSGNAKWKFCNMSGAAVDRVSDTYSIRVVR